MGKPRLSILLRMAVVGLAVLPTACGSSPTPEEAAEAEALVAEDEVFSNAWGDLTRDFIVQLSGRPWFNTRKEIERIVGDPWTLNETTLAKSRTLPSRLRVDFLSNLVRRFPDFGEDAQLEPAGRLDELARTSPEMLQIVLDEEQSEEIADSSIEVIEDVLDSEEQIDIGFWVLSHSSGFPENDTQWESFKQRLVRNDIWIGLTVFAIQMGNDEAQVSMSGKLGKIRNRYGRQILRVGWRARFRYLGYEWKPKMDIGFKAKAPWLDARITYIEDYRRRPNTLFRSAQLRLDENLLAFLTRPYGWETSISAAYSYNIEHGNEALSNKDFFSSGVFTRKNDAFGPGRNFVLSASHSTDFDLSRSTSVSLGSENQFTGASTLIFTSHTTSNEFGEDEVRGGFILAQTLGHGRAYVSARRIVLTLERRMRHHLDRIAYWHSRMKQDRELYDELVQRQNNRFEQAMRNNNVKAAAAARRRRNALEAEGREAVNHAEAWLRMAARALLHDLTVWDYQHQEHPVLHLKQGPKINPALLNEVRAAAGILKDVMEDEKPWAALDEGAPVGTHQE